MNFIRLSILSLTLAFASPLAAQDDDVEYRYELGAAAGIDFSLTDVNSKWFGNTQFAGGAVARFLLNPRMAIKTTLSYAKIGGSTDHIKNFYPAAPSAPGTETLHFKANSGLIDLSALYEINFLPYGYAQGYQGYKRLVPYLQMGMGFCYSTKGKAFSANIPLGFGVKYKVAPRLNLGLEWRMHLSMSDKIENLEAPLGIESSGFKNKDHYSFTLLSITYDLSPRCPNCNKD